MKVLFRLHGELLMGNRGSAVVELAASWAIIMIVTGLYLWWPRKAKTLAGIVYPRLAAGSRIFWCDIHAVTGFWISGLALFLLLSGLPWAKFWGDYFKNVRRLTGTAVVRQDWSNGQSANVNSQSAGASGEHSEHHGGSGRGGRRGRGATPSDLTAVDRIVATVAPGPARACRHRTSGHCFWRLDREIDDAESSAPRRSRDGWRDRRNQGSQRLQRPSPVRQDHRNGNRRARGPTLRLAQSALGPCPRPPAWSCWA